MHKKAKITYPRFKGIPGILTAQGFHKGRLDCVEVSVVHCRDGIVINASSRKVFHRRRLALPSSTSLSSTISTLLNSSTKNSSKLEENKKAEMSTIEGRKRTKADTGEEKVEILLRDAFGTFKGEVPYYSARIMSIPEVVVPGLEELDEVYEEWIEKGEEK